MCPNNCLAPKLSNCYISFSYAHITLPKLHTLHFPTCSISPDGFRWVVDPSRFQLGWVHKGMVESREPSEFDAVGRYVHPFKRIFPPVEVLEQWKDLNVLLIK
jgi:hypothetical protein